MRGFKIIGHALVLAVLVGYVMGCAGMQRDKKLKSFKAASKNYTDDVRWQKFGTAARYVEEKNKDRFFNFYESTREQLTITDYNILSAEIDKTDSNKARARVYVSYFNLPDVQQKQGMWVQEWVWRDDEGGWVIASPEIALRKSNQPLPKFKDSADGIDKEMMR